MPGMRELERGRPLFVHCAWLEAYDSLARADREGAVAPEDLELLATAAYLLGRDAERLSALQRAHQGHLYRGEVRRPSAAPSGSARI